VIAVGGDGTVHEVINGIMELPAERRPRLGVVPLGSGNDFAHAIGMKPDSSLALRQIFTGKPRKIDIGKVVDGRGRVEYWDNALGIGFDTVVTLYSRQLPLVRGFLMYTISVLETIILKHEAPELNVKTDIEAWKEPMLMLVLCNGGREGGGFMVSPEARPDDGIFHYAGVTSISRPMMLRLVPEVMRGTHGRFQQVRMGQFHQLELEADRPLYIHTDGEIFSGFGMDVRKISVEILPGAIEVMG
jgi:YegS/Rv2252/BmrU family lipid kinase